MPTSEHTQTSIVLPEISADTQPRVLSQEVLSPQEIERICKAFIRLITSGEEQYGDSTKNANIPTQTANITC